jgi:hypothetical protein
MISTLMQSKHVEFLFPSSRRFLLRFRTDFLVFPKINIHDAEHCLYDDAWASHQCNSVSWNTAVCVYPHLVSDSSTVTWLAPEDMGVFQYDDYFQCKFGGKQVSFDPSLQKPSVDSEQRRFMWIVDLPLAKSGRECDSDDHEIGAWDKGTETAFNVCFQDLLDMW